MNFFLSAADCNPQREIPLPLLARYIIDTATDHANTLNIGYARLLADNATWVLSRLAIEMTTFPAINSAFTIETWIESINRVFSKRNFRIADSHGNTLGYARSIWAAINIDTRNAVELTPYIQNLPIENRDCPIAPTPRLAPITNPDSTIPANFQYTDVDFNRHINTTRYIEHFLNTRTVEFFDANRIARFDIIFHAETRLTDPSSLLTSTTHIPATPAVRPTSQLPSQSPTSSSQSPTSPPQSPTSSSLFSTANGELPSLIDNFEIIHSGITATQSRLLYQPRP